MSGQSIGDSVSNELAMNKLVAKHINLFKCPNCGGSFAAKATSLTCKSCKRSYKLDGDIPLMFHEQNKDPKEVTKTIKAFYEKTPFPNYDAIDSKAVLKKKAEEGVFAKLLDEQIPNNSKILEVGCGTGQLSNFLGMTYGRTVFGADMCLNSLRLGDKFRKKNAINNVAFVQMNLFHPVFKDESFDVVICNGVLHHTYNASLGFSAISKLVKPGGHIVIGLYNTYGRLFTDLRRLIFRVTGNSARWLDSRLVNVGIDDIRKLTWFRDQYQNPHESKHTMGELIGWFEREGFEYVNGVPKPTIADKFSPEESLFEKSSPGNAIERGLVQLGMIFTTYKEGGFYVMIGKKV